jgi:uncharacterized protein YbaP (TraB family)
MAASNKRTLIAPGAWHLPGHNGLPALCIAPVTAFG